MKKVILSIVFIFISVISYSQVFNLEIDGYTYFKHESSILTKTAISENKFLSLGEGNFDNPKGRITYNLTDSTWVSHIPWGEDIVVESGKIIRTIDPDVFLSVIIESITGERYYVFISELTNEPGKLGIYVRWLEQDENNQYITGWWSDRFNIYKN